MIPDRTAIKSILASGCLLFITCGCLLTSIRSAWPLLYKPSCDLQPVLSLRLPDRIETLAACPRDETYAVNGINKSGERWPDNAKEFFRLRRAETDFESWVFFTENAAVERYQSEKRWISKGGQSVFREVTEDGRNICVYYTKQERADPEGGSGPMGIYHARASFRLRNAFIGVETTETRAKSDTLSLAVRDLAQMLIVGLGTTNQVAR